MSIMKASELVRRHIDAAKNYKTVYMWGCFGSPVTNGIITEKANQYPDWYGAAKQASLRNLIGKGYFGFDCVNLTKGILWGWNGNKNAYHGGARYAGNTVPDVSADGMIAKCKDVATTGWDKLVPGEGLWMPGRGWTTTRKPSIRPSRTPRRPSRQRPDLRTTRSNISPTTSTAMIS